MRLRPLLTVLLLGAAATTLAGEPAGGHAGTQTPPVNLDALEGGAKLHALISEVVARQRAMHSLRARFDQRKESSLLLKPAESSGTFSYLAPDRVRWDYREPDPLIVVFSDDTLTTYFPKQRRAERVKLQARQRRFLRVLAGTQPLDELSSRFRMILADPGGEAPYQLTLEPTSRMVARKLSAVVLEIDRHLLLPVAVEYREADGDVTRYRFSDIHVDEPLGPDLFRLQFNADVRIDTVRVPSAGVD